MTKSKDQALLYLVTATVITLLLLLFFSYLNKESSPVDSGPDEEIVLDDFFTDELITRPIDDNSTVKFGKTEIKLAEGYFVTSIFLTSETTELDCLADEAACTVYEISTDADQYYISPDDAIVFVDFTLGNSFTDEIVIDNKEVLIYGYKTEYFANDVFTEELTLEEDEGESSDLITQIYGCLDNGLCYNSGLFGFDLEANASKIEAFYKFLATINK